MKASTEQIITTLAGGDDVYLYFIQNSWVRGGVDEVNVDLGNREKADLIIHPSYYIKFKDAIDSGESIDLEEIEGEVEILAKIMRTAYSKLLGGALQLHLA